MNTNPSDKPHPVGRITDPCRLLEYLPGISLVEPEECALLNTANALPAMGQVVDLLLSRIPVTPDESKVTPLAVQEMAESLVRYGQGDEGCEADAYLDSHSIDCYVVPDVKLLAGARSLDWPSVRCRIVPSPKQKGRLRKMKAAPVTVDTPSAPEYSLADLKPEALHALRKHLLYLFLGFGLNAADGKDLIQDVLVIFIERKRKAHNPQGWVWKAAERKALTQLGFIARRHHKEGMQLPLDSEAKNSAPSSRMELLEMEEALRAAVRSLPDNQKAVLTARAEKVRWASIASANGISRNTAIRRFHAACKGLAPQLIAYA